MNPSWLGDVATPAPLLAADPPPESAFMQIGAGAFGAVLGWYLYYVNRYRRDEVKLADLVTVIGAIGGGAVLALFPQGTLLFASYGIGLAVGFFGYFLTLVTLVNRSNNFGVDWFLDGRRKKPAADELPGKPGERPME